ncbi:unnamed protein product, partial [marine sediment metagenome]
MVTCRYGTPPRGSAGTAKIRAARTGPAAPPARKGTVAILPSEGGQGVVRFDLSDLPKGTNVYRADLRIFRNAKITGRDEAALVNIEIYPLFSNFAPGRKPKVFTKPLELRGPWYDRFEATAAMRQWVAGQPNGGFFVKTCPRWNAQATCLDIAYEGKPGNVPPQATGLRVFHRAGQTFVTWKEIDDPLGRDRVKWGQLRRILSNLDRDKHVRYCIYR